MDEVTKHGRWIRKKANEHFCSKPLYKIGTSVGDLWQCNTCNRIWRVETMGWDQRDNSGWITWTQHSYMDIVE